MLELSFIKQEIKNKAGQHPGNTGWTTFRALACHPCHWPNLSLIIIYIIGASSSSLLLSRPAPPQVPVPLVSSYLIIFSSLESKAFTSTLPSVLAVPQPTNQSYTSVSFSPLSPVLSARCSRRDIPRSRSRPAAVTVSEYCGGMFRTHPPILPCSWRASVFSSYLSLHLSTCQSHPHPPSSILVLYPHPAAHQLPSHTSSSLALLRPDLCLLLLLWLTPDLFLTPVTHA
ncbi:hypothetical protein ElyMa_004200700 [Elysia marginata]|uniref:Uncharacterized protein n=1 Tax=Elysia marginata TaxID=1093978 RepID=A0AAV4GMM6_9GAST|nr:hypothetical protein ElyMa_004200700 [Elysia marginata]